MELNQSLWYQAKSAVPEGIPNQCQPNDSFIYKSVPFPRWLLCLPVAFWVPSAYSECINCDCRWVTRWSTHIHCMERPPHSIEAICVSVWIVLNGKSGRATRVFTRARDTLGCLFAEQETAAPPPTSRTLSVTPESPADHHSAGWQTKGSPEFIWVSVWVRPSARIHQRWLVLREMIPQWIEYFLCSITPIIFIKESKLLKKTLTHILGPSPKTNS